MMEVEEKSMIKAILEDVKSLKSRVEGMEGMLETLVEIYTDAFYEVKDEYLGAHPINRNLYIPPSSIEMIG